MRTFANKNLSAWVALSVALVMANGCGSAEDFARGALAGAAEAAAGSDSASSTERSREAREGGGAPAKAVAGGGPGIALSDAAGVPGKVVEVRASLSTGGRKIAGAQNDLRFDPSVLSVAEGRNGKPDCAVNPSINKSASAFAFTPSGCKGKSCTGVRALILSLTDVKPIADGSRLYTCRVAIAAGAKSGTHELGMSGVSLSTPEGDAVKASGQSASIEVR